LYEDISRSNVEKKFQLRKLSEMLKLGDRNKQKNCSVWHKRAKIGQVSLKQLLYGNPAKIDHIAMLYLALIPT
jgi:hypothetical protein